MNPEIKKYLQELLRDAGQTGLGDAVENQMMEDLYTRLEDRLTITALSYLNADQVAELEGMSEGKKNAKFTGTVEAFFKKHIPDYEQVFARVLLEFRNLYIEAVAQ